MWISDVALAVGQAEDTNLTPGNLSASVETEALFYHGGYVGFELVK